MPDSPRSVRRRIQWIVVLIIFMVALAAVYMVMSPHRTARRVGAIDPDAPARTH